jgi:DNA-binding transcriptional regulator YhcF (GntR family)
MARLRSARIEQVKRKLATSLAHGLHRPGDRFLSNRAVAKQYAISYQTADRLIGELAAEGLLRRSAGSGTFVPGMTARFAGVQLIFHRRAKRKGSFGARLLRELTERLDRDGIEWRMAWADDDRSPTLSPGRYPVIWECPAAISNSVAHGRSALLLNDRAPSGLASLIVDSISVDDFSGGACAAELFLKRDPIRRGTKRRFAILAGPTGDARSSARVAGFLSVAPATVVPAANWFFEAGLAAADRALAGRPDAIFCCNDRLAEGVLTYCRKHHLPRPPVIGFDDAPIARWLDLTTIAIPWRDFTSSATAVIQQRLAGLSTGVGSRVLAVVPVVREL